MRIYHAPLAVLDISLSRDLYFLTIVGGANGHKDALSVSPAEKEILIPPLIRKNANRPELLWLVARYRAPRPSGSAYIAPAN